MPPALLGPPQQNPNAPPAFGAAGPSGIMTTLPGQGGFAPTGAQANPPPAPNIGGPGGPPPQVPGQTPYSGLLGSQIGLNYQNFQNQINAGRPNQTNPFGSSTWAQDPSTGKWTQNTGFSAAVGGPVNQAFQGAGSALSGFSPANNPTYQGPSNVGNLQFDPANVAENLYQSQMGLREPGMQAQSNALDQVLKAQGYDVNQAGGAQTAENNLMNQQNLVRAQASNWAAGQAIPQGAQALGAQESIPLANQQLAQGAFNAGVTGAQLPIGEATGLMNIGMGSANALPQGQSQVPGLQGVDVLGASQQNYANQMSGYNAGQANSTNQMNGILGLAGAGIGAYASNPSPFNNAFSWLGNQFSF